MISGTHFRTVCLLLSMLTFSGVILAQDTGSPVRLDDFITEALENNPEIKYNRLNYEAALSAVPQAGAWTDPTVSATRVETANTKVSRPRRGGTDPHRCMGQIPFDA